MLPSKLNLRPTCILEGLLRELYLHHIAIHYRYTPVNIWHVRSWGKFPSFILPSRSQRGKVSKYFVDVRPIRRKLNWVRGSSMSCEEMGEIPPSDGMDFPPYRHFKLAQPSASLPNPHSIHPTQILLPWLVHQTCTGDRQYNMG